MADFLSETWFAELNESLRAAGPVPLEGATYRVVIEMTDAPSSVPHAITLTLDNEASAQPGDHLAADSVLRLSFSDGAALFEGRLDSAEALRTGRVKLRGDVTALVSCVEWLQRAHPATA